MIASYSYFVYSVCIIRIRVIKVTYGFHLRTVYCCKHQSQVVWNYYSLQQYSKQLLLQLAGRNTLGEYIEVLIHSHIQPSSSNTRNFCTRILCKCQYQALRLWCPVSEALAIGLSCVLHCTCCMWHWVVSQANLVCYIEQWRLTGQFPMAQNYKPCILWQQCDY